MAFQFLITLCFVHRLNTFDLPKTNYFETYYIQPDSNNGRNAIKMDQYKWPNGTVPYIFDSTYNEKNRNIVLSAMNSIMDNSCVKFVPKEDKQVEHIRFIKTPACGSNVGYRANQTEPLDVTYSEYCLSVFGAVQHELLHVLGLLHEQARPDRDDYVHIIWENIDPRKVKIVFFIQQAFSFQFRL